MKHGLIASCIAASLFLAAGCARLQVYKDEAMKGPETGFRFYVSKPYLLVAFNSPQPNAMEVSVVHLPDLDTPYWVKPQPGLFGNSNLKMDFENGVMKGFGQEVTSNVTGLLDSLGGFRKALAEAGKADREARGAAAVTGQSADKNVDETLFFHLYEIRATNGATSLKRVNLAK